MSPIANEHDSSGRRYYRYQMLDWFGAISTTIAALVAVVGGLLAVGLLFTRRTELGASLVLALGVAVATVVSAVSIAVAAVVVRWMHDVVNLLDEQVVALDELADRRERVDA